MPEGGFELHMLHATLQGFSASTSGFTLHLESSDGLPLAWTRFPLLPEETDCEPLHSTSNSLNPKPPS